MDTLMLAVRVLLSLGAVVALLWLIQRRATAVQRGALPGDVLTVVSRRGLGQKSAVVVVETDGKRFLLGVTEHSVNVLHTSEAPEPVPAAETQTDTAGVFARKLSEVSTGTAQPGPVRRRRQQQPRTSPLAGSILSADTWKQAASAARKGLFG
jgi:flagellar protein FliO/FliZ